MNKIVLVIAAHSDDEALGCSGTILKHIDNGDSVHLLFMTDGVGSRSEKQNNSKISLSNAKKAAKIFGVRTFTNLNYPDNSMDSISLLDVVKKIENKIAEIKPEVIYTHHIGDLNVDHQVTHKAVLTACRPVPGFSVKKIYAFEVLSSTEWQTPGIDTFCPNVFIDISSYINKKKQILEVYSDEMRQKPHSRSVNNVINLNQIRGNSVGVDYAEAFILIRMVQ